MKKFVLFAALMSLTFACVHKRADQKTTTSKPEMASKATKPQSEKIGAALKPFYSVDHSIRKFLDKSYAYIVFPKIGKGAVGIGGAYGKGSVYERSPSGFHLVGKAELTQISAGLQLGAQTYSQVVFFENEAAFNQYKKSGFELSASASVVALKKGRSANAIFKDGVATIVLGEEGLMGELSIAGQKLSYKPIKE